MDSWLTPISPPPVKGIDLLPPVVLGNPHLVKPYQIINMPVTLPIDRDGRIADAHVGIVVKDEWEREIRRLLTERAP